MPGKKTEVPGTLRRSPEKAQRTWREAHDSAIETYGEGERAHRVAYSALKHTHEKVGDHWEPKDRSGPSDAQAAQGGAAARDRPRPTAGGVDERGSSREELYRRARDLGVRGASRMTKQELAQAIARKQR
jgi:cation transport regulator ChaB